MPTALVLPIAGAMAPASPLPAAATRSSSILSPLAGSGPMSPDIPGVGIAVESAIAILRSAVLHAPVTAPPDAELFGSVVPHVLEHIDAEDGRGGISRQIDRIRGRKRRDRDIRFREFLQENSALGFALIDARAEEFDQRPIADGLMLERLAAASLAGNVERQARDVGA